jgi:A/G-specific adenine glycosylase
VKIKAYGEVKGLKKMIEEKQGDLTPTSRVARQFARRLLDWYKEHGRDLPWRRTQDPYHILVSEIMLQQTQVERVLRYYPRFLETFPDLKALAEAPLDRVLKMWEGMGYYARARNLHRAAQIILGEYGGRVPSELSTLQALPGVGYNTAASVASFAYERAWPVLDGNAVRILCRAFLLRGDPRVGVQHKRLLALAKTLQPEKWAGPFNQALMDLGALICRPKNPQCAHCPLSILCAGYGSGNPASLPHFTRRPPRPHYHITAGIIWRGKHFLIAQRQHHALLGGLWEFPGGKQEKEETLEQCLRREIREELGIHIRVKEPFMSLKHGYSHFRFTLHAFHCTYLKGRPRPLGCAAFKWIQMPELQSYALPRADQKLAAALRAAVGP